MQRGRLVLVLGGLRKDPAKSVHQVFGCVLAGFSDLIDLMINVAMHAPDSGLTRAQRPLHPVVLLGVCMPADLHRNSQYFAVVGLGASGRYPRAASPGVSAISPAVASLSGAPPP